MEAFEGQALADMLDLIFRIPQEVVYRSFAHETVILNLKTGRYHGLNPTAGIMLAELERGASPRDVAAVLALRFERPVSEIEHDACGLCAELLERGLLEPSAPARGDPDGA